MVPDWIDQLCNEYRCVEEIEFAQLDDLVLLDSSKILSIPTIDETNVPGPTLDEFVQRGDALNNKTNSIVGESDQTISNDKKTSRITNSRKKNRIFYIKDFC